MVSKWEVALILRRFENQVPPVDYCDMIQQTPVTPNWIEAGMDGYSVLFLKWSTQQWCEIQIDYTG